MRGLSALVVLVGLFLVGCSGDPKAQHYTADEQKAVDDYNKMTPQQQIERAQNSPMPEGAKEALIKQIKEKNGIK